MIMSQPFRIHLEPSAHCYGHKDLSHPLYKYPHWHQCELFCLLMKFHMSYRHSGIHIYLLLLWIGDLRLPNPSGKARRYATMISILYIYWVEPADIRSLEVLSQSRLKPNLPPWFLVLLQFRIDKVMEYGTTMPRGICSINNCTSHVPRIPDLPLIPYYMRQKWGTVVFSDFL